jgi:two-component system, NarL family, response regulator LiaR
VVQGYSNQEIANKLFVSLATVRFHVSTILAKLGAANRAEAAALAVMRKLL